MELKIGNKKKALDFISNLKKDDKIALLSHTDLDGIVCAKIIGKIVEINYLDFVSYNELDGGLISKLKDKKINKIIFTDINIKDKEFVEKLEEFAEILIIDHHIAKNLNSRKTVFILGEKGYSAGYLCYELFSEIKDFEKLDWLVACSCLSDYCHIKPKKWLEEVFEKYGDKLEYKGTYVRKSGVFWDLQCKLSLALLYFGKRLKKVYDNLGEEFEDMGDLDKAAEEVQEELDKHISDFGKDREEFELGYFLEINPKFGISSILATILSGEEIDKVYVIIKPKKHMKIKGDFYSINVRRQDKKFDCVKFLAELFKDLKDVNFGGHIPAAGGFFRKQYLPEVRKRLGLKLK